VAAARAKAKDCKALIERGHAIDAETPHHSEAGALDDGNLLIAPGESDVPSNL